jgi:hypothetical protein
VGKKQVPDQLLDCVERERETQRERERERERELVETEVETSRVGCRERAGLERERERGVERDLGRLGVEGGGGCSWYVDL